MAALQALVTLDNLTWPERRPLWADLRYIALGATMLLLSYLYLKNPQI